MTHFAAELCVSFLGCLGALGLGLGLLQPDNLPCKHFFGADLEQLGAINSAAGTELRLSFTMSGGYVSRQSRCIKW